MCYTFVMTNALKEAIAKVAALPKAAQQRIGEELLLHVAKVDRLRSELRRGIQSLDHGEGRELHIKDVIKRARAHHGEARS
jgi:hypothetical protein